MKWLLLIVLVLLLSGCVNYQDFNMSDKEIQQLGENIGCMSACREFHDKISNKTLSSPCFDYCEQKHPFKIEGD